MTKKQMCVYCIIYEYLWQIILGSLEVLPVTNFSVKYLPYILILLMYVFFCIFIHNNYLLIYWIWHVLFIKFSTDEHLDCCDLFVFSFAVVYVTSLLPFWLYLLVPQKCIPALFRSEILSIQKIYVRDGICVCVCVCVFVCIIVKWPFRKHCISFYVNFLFCLWWKWVLWISHTDHVKPVWVHSLALDNV